MEVEYLISREQLIYILLCVCSPPCSFKCDALELFSQDTSSVAVNNCIFCLSSEKTFLVYRIDSYLQWVGGQQYMIIVLVLEKSIMGWEKPFIRPCLLFRLSLCGAISPPRDFFSPSASYNNGMLLYALKQNSEPRFPFNDGRLNPCNSLWNLICGDNTKLR